MGGRRGTGRGEGGQVASGGGPAQVRPFVVVGIATGLGIRIVYFIASFEILQLWGQKIAGHIK